MMAFVGFASVYANRGMLPIEALKAHMADSGQQNSEFPLLLFLIPCATAGPLTTQSWRVSISVEPASSTEISQQLHSLAEVIVRAFPSSEILLQPESDLGTMFQRVVIT